MDLHHHNNSHSLCENSENNNAQSSGDLQITVALWTEHLSQNIYSSVQFVSVRQ